MENKVNLIYILGTSYSGSSLLGFILGSSKKVFDAGELKFLNRLQKRGGEICSCGVNSLKCSFWEKIYNQNFDIYQSPSFFKKIKIIIKVLFKKKTSKNIIKYKDEYELIKQISNNQKDNIKFVLDASKSIWRLNHLIKFKNINLKIIYLKRPITGNVSSFMKHGEGFWRGLITYKFNNYLIKKFLKINKLKYFKVNYQDLCKNPKEQLNKIGKDLKIDYSNYVKNVRKRKYHVPSGNRGTRKQFLQNFQGLKADNSWEKKLNKFQKFIVGAFK